jgi:hypothetical protein
MKSTQVSKGRLARLLEFDDELNAMLLERCRPGTPLRALAEDDQDVSGSGSSRALLRNHATIGPMTILFRWREPALHKTDGSRTVTALHLGCSGVIRHS